MHPQVKFNKNNDELSLLNLTKVLMIFPVIDDWDKLKGYSDINVSVQGLELLHESRSQTDQKWWITKVLGQTMCFVVRKFVQAIVSGQQSLNPSGEWRKKTKLTSKNPWIEDMATKASIWWAYSAISSRKKLPFESVVAC